MPDDLARRGKADRIRINVHEDHELRQWCQKFGVTPDRLKAAVAKVGPMADAVERELKAA
jgi:hypothetical protein